MSKAFATSRKTAPVFQQGGPAVSGTEPILLVTEQPALGPCREELVCNVGASQTKQNLCRTKGEEAASGPVVSKGKTGVARSSEGDSDSRGPARTSPKLG